MTRARFLESRGQESHNAAHHELIAQYATSKLSSKNRNFENKAKSKTFLL